MTLVKHGNPRNINYLFDEIFNTFPSNWGSDSHAHKVNPSVNIHETSDGYHLELTAPGLNKEDFKIHAADGLLTISYEKKEETEQKEYKTIRREFIQRSFKRSFGLDDKVNVDGIEAKYENGILKLLLPKKEEVKVTPKEITIL